MPGKKGSSGGGILDGISTIVERLAELAEKGEKLQKSGEIGSSDKKVKGAYDIDVRILGGADREERGPQVEPVEKPRAAPRASIQPIREPLVDVFDEEAGLLVVAQLPGIPCKEVMLELREDILTVHAEHDDLRYHKELLLPRSFTKDQLHATCRNGVVEIELTGTGAEGSSK